MVAAVAVAAVAGRLASSSDRQLRAVVISFLVISFVPPSAGLNGTWSRDLPPTDTLTPTASASLRVSVSTVSTVSLTSIPFKSRSSLNATEFNHDLLSTSSGGLYSVQIRFMHFSPLSLIDSASDLSCTQHQAKFNLLSDKMVFYMSLKSSGTVRSIYSSWERLYQMQCNFGEFSEQFHSEYYLISFISFVFPL